MIKKYNVVFAGTSYIARPFLDSIAKSGKFNITTILTKRITSKKRPTILDHINTNQHLYGHININYEPAKNIEPEALNDVDAMLVVSYGYKIPKYIIDSIPCINMHASLLPKLRGAAPIEHSIIEGHAYTGATVMLMDYNIDTGPIITQYSIPICTGTNFTEYTADNYYSIESKIMSMSDKFAYDAYRFLQNEVSAVEQDHSLASYAPIITNTDSLLSFKMPGTSILNRINGLCCTQPCKVQIESYRMKILRAQFYPHNSIVYDGYGTLHHNNTLIDTLSIQLRDGILELIEVLPDAGKKMSGSAFCRGHKLYPGCRACFVT